VRISTKPACEAKGQFLKQLTACSGTNFKSFQRAVQRLVGNLEDGGEEEVKWLTISSEEAKSRECLLTGCCRLSVSGENRTEENQRELTTHLVETFFRLSCD
jgi:hypothetical protein